MNGSSPCGRTAADALDHLLRLTAEQASRVLVVDGPSAEFALLQHDERWDAIVLPRDLETIDDGTLRAVLHVAVQHLSPGGRVVAVVPTSQADRLLGLGIQCELRLEERSDSDGSTIVVHRRSMRFNVHDLVFEARSTIRRYEPAELASRLSEPAGPLVIDTRTHTDRERFGVIPGSVHAPRTVLEWHLDPANGYQLPGLRDLDHPLVVVCNGGYSSSLAAANLVRLGFADVGDLRGGVHAWQRAGFPLVDPDHSHLDPHPCDP